MRGGHSSNLKKYQLEIPLHLVEQAQLYAPSRHPLDAVCHVLQDYPRLIGELRQLRRQLDGFDRETADFDTRLQALQAACRAILDL